MTRITRILHTPARAATVSSRAEKNNVAFHVAGQSEHHSAPKAVSAQSASSAMEKAAADEQPRPQVIGDSASSARGAPTSCRAARSVAVAVERPSAPPTIGTRRRLPASDPPDAATNPAGRNATTNTPTTAIEPTAPARPPHRANRRGERVASVCRLSAIMTVTLNTMPLNAPTAAHRAMPAMIAVEISRLLPVGASHRPHT
jgi:hypothetical protein